jgi:predicted acyltransferase
MAIVMQTESNASTERIVSLDVMRGFTMAAMIVVNNPGSWSHVYSPLLHAPWHGCTPTDLVFPFFLFIVGVAMPFSLEKRKQASNGTWKKVLWRSALLFAIGFALGLFPDVFTKPSVILEARWPGVLQRIAICYAVVALMVLSLPRMGQRTVASLLVVTYLFGMLFVNVPGYGAGVLEPLGNFCWWLDNQLLLGHVWKESPAKGFDPEGVWSTLPAIVTTYLGYEIGVILRLGNITKEQKLIRLFLLANAGLAIGFLFSWIIPINKQLWTPSYLFLTAGAATHFLAICFWYTDLRGARIGIRWTLIFGTNAIFAYILSSLGGDIYSIIPVSGTGLKQALFNGLVSLSLPPKLVSFTMALFFLGVCWICTSLLYRKRIFLRL